MNPTHDRLWVVIGTRLVGGEAFSEPRMLIERPMEFVIRRFADLEQHLERITTDRIQCVRYHRTRPSRTVSMGSPPDPTRRMLAAALEAEGDAYLGAGQRLVVRNDHTDVRTGRLGVGTLLAAAGPGGQSGGQSGGGDGSSESAQLSTNVFA